MSINRNLTTETFNGSIRTNAFVLDGNKFYNRTNVGGISRCINGNPMRNGANVLCNCVGFAWGAFNETWSKGSPDTWKGFTFVNGDGKNIYGNAKAAGWQCVEPSGTPPLGGLIVWGGKGNHVAYIAEVIDNNTIRILQSGYNTPSWTQRNINNTGWVNDDRIVTRTSNWGYRGTPLGFVVNPGANKVPTPDDNPAKITSILQISQTNIRVNGNSNGVSGITTGSRIYYKWNSNTVSSADYSGYVDGGITFDVNITKPREATSVAICPYQINTTGLVVMGIISVSQLTASIPCIYVTTSSKRCQGIPYIFTQGQWKSGVPLIYANGKWNTIYNDKE